MHNPSPWTASLPHSSTASERLCHSRGTYRAWLLLSALVATSCGEDATVLERAAPPPTSSEAIQPEPIEDTGPLYALITQVFAGDGGANQSYIVLTPTLDSSESPDLTQAIELPGRAIGAGPDGGRALFVGGDAAPTLTRYDLEADSSLTEGDTLSFAGQGLVALGEYGGQFHFASPTQAYFFDGSTASVLFWNPEDMTVQGAESLPDLVVEGAQLSFSAAPLVLDDSVITFAGWRTMAEVPAQAGIVQVNTATNEVNVAVDNRCGYVRDGALGPDGYVYLATEAYGAAVNRLNPDNANAPCLLRFDPESGQFDPDFHVELGELVDGETAGSLIRGTDGALFLRVLDETLFPIAADTSPRLLASVPAWRWGELTLGDEPSVTMTDQEASGGSLISFTFEQSVQGAFFSGRESTTFAPLDPEGLGEEGLSVTGLVFAAARLR